MNNILRTIKRNITRYAAMALAIMCFLAVPFSAACSTTGDNKGAQNSGIVADGGTVNTPNSDITVGGDESSEKPSEPVNPVIPENPDNGDNGTETPVEPENPDNGDNGTETPVEPVEPGQPDIGGESGEPVVPPAPEVPVVTTLASYELPNGVKYTDANNNDWSTINIGNATTNHEEGWRLAVIQSITTTGAVKVILDSDWVATEDFVMGSSFGSGAGFGDYNTYAYGPIKVPVGATIVLDLNGHKIDRNLTKSATTPTMGMVIMVNGALNIVDSRPTAANTIINPNTFVNTAISGDTMQASMSYQGGVITGGMNLYGAGVYVGQMATAECILTSGSIAGNIATDGGANGVNGNGRSGGVYMANNATFIMKGGKISYNTARYGGGIFLASDGNLDIQGGEISYNTATAKTTAPGQGGGFYTQKTFDLKAGTITHNDAVSGNVSTATTRTQTSYGGGVYSTGTFTISGGEISYNTSMLGGAIQASTLYVNGGSVDHNVGTKWPRTGDARGQVINFGTLYFNGGEIAYNSCTGRGLLHGSTFIMTGGKLHDNSNPNNELIWHEAGTYDSRVLGGEIYNNSCNYIIFAVSTSPSWSYIELKDVSIHDNTVRNNLVHTYNYTGSNQLVLVEEGTRIYNNTVTNHVIYGSVCADVRISGGEIYNNTVGGYGVRGERNRKLEISGAPQIYGNHASGNTTTEKNVYVFNNTATTSPIRITGALKVNGKNAHIGLTLETYNTSAYPITSGYGAIVNDANTYNYFFIDNPSYYSTRLYNNEVYYYNANRPSSVNAWQVKDGDNAWKTDLVSGTSGYTKVYDGKPLQVRVGTGSVLNLTSSSNGTSGNSVVNAGTYLFTNGTGSTYKNSTFTVTILPQEVKVTGTPTVASKQYDGNTSATVSVSNMRVVNAPAGVSLSFVGRAEFPDATIANSKRLVVYLTFNNPNYVPDVDAYYCWANITAKPNPSGVKTLTSITAQFALTSRVIAATINGVGIADTYIKNKLTVTAYYSDGTTKGIGAGSYSISGNKTYGTQTFTASYTEGGVTRTANFDIDFLPKDVVGLRLANNQSGRVIYYSEISACVATDSYVLAYLQYSDGTEMQVSSSHTGFSYSSTTGTTTDAFGQLCGPIKVTANYQSWISNTTGVEVTVTPLQVSTVTAVFAQPSAPIFKTTNINDLKSYITVSYTRNDGVSGSLGASAYTINGSLSSISGGYATLSVRSTQYGVNSNTFQVAVQDKEIIAVGTRVTQTEDQIIYEGYPLTILPNYVQVRILYNTDVTGSLLRQYITAEFLNTVGRSDLVSELNGANTDEKIFALYNKLIAAHRQSLYERMFANDGTWNSLTRINDYTLSGKLTTGRPYITATYGGVSTRFQVTVIAIGYTHFASHFNSSGLVMYDTSSIEDLRSRLTIYTIATNGVAGTAAQNEYNLEYAGYYDASNTAHYEAPTTGRALQRGSYNIIRAYYVNNRSVSTTFRVWVESIYIVGIEAVYTQPTRLVFVGEPLNNFKNDLKVTVVMSDPSKSYTVTNYTLSGDVTEGNITINVTYGGFRTSFRSNVVAVRVQSITAVITQGSNLVYASTPNSTLRGWTTVTAKYNNGTSQAVTNYTLNATLVADATVPVTVTYDGIDVVQDGSFVRTVSAGSVKVEAVVLVRLNVIFNADAQNSTKWPNSAVPEANKVYETANAADTKTELAKISSIKTPAGANALRVIPYYSKNGKLVGAKAGDDLKANEYELAIDPKMNSEFLKAGANEITVSHGGFVASFSVEVTKIQVSKLDVTKNGINDANTSASGNLNVYASTSPETIKTKLTVVASYNKPGMAQKTIAAADYRLVAPVTIVGDQLNKYTVIYTEDGVTSYGYIDIYVQPRILASLKATFTTSGNDKFYTDDNLQEIGHAPLRGQLIVEAYYSDETHETVQFGNYVLSGTLMPGTNIITANYGGKSDTFEVNNVQQAKIESIHIQSFNPNNVKIYTSTPLNSLKDLLTVSYTMNSGTPGTLDKNDYTVTGSLQRVISDEGEVTEPYITVVYNQDNTITDTRSPIVVESTRLDRIEVVFNQSTANNGSELVVYAGTNLNEIKGFITRVLAHYTDGATTSSEEVLDYALSGSFATAGTSTVTVTYNGKSTTFNVRVTALAVTSIKADFNQISRVFTATPLETIKNMLTVTPIYNNGQPGTALKANEYKLERVGAYLETYDGYQNPVTGLTASSSLTEHYVYLGDNPTDQQIQDSTLEVTYNDHGVEVVKYYRNATAADVTAGTPIYHITRSHTTVEGDFIAGELGLFRVIPNAYPTLTPATFTANIDSARLIRIEATLGAIDRTIYDSNSLDVLRQWLVVNAVYEEAIIDGDTEGATGETSSGATYIVKERIIGDYTLNTATGKLNAGNCSVAVGYNGLIDSIVVRGVVALAVDTVTAVYNQEGKVYESTPLEDLKDMLTITAYNNDGSSKPVNADGYTLEIIKTGETASNAFVHGQTSTVKVTLKEDTHVTTTFTVDVENNILVNITVDNANAAGVVTLPAGVTVYTSTDLNSIKQYITVNANLSNRSDGAVTSSERVVDFDISGELTAPTSVLLISYNGKITSCVIQPVTPVLATGISASIDQTAKVYTTTELESLKSMITVDATYNNGTSGTVGAENYTLQGELVPGTTCAVTVIYTAPTEGTINTVTVYVDVEATVLTRITYDYSQTDNDVIYASDDPDDIYKLSQWLRVYAHYSEGGIETEVQEVGGYTLTGNLTAGYIPIIITYNGLTAFFNAQITAVSLMGISVSYTPVTEVYAATPVDSLKDMLYVEAYYNNGKTEELAKEDYYLSVETVDDSGKTVGYFIASKISTVTVTYGKNVNLTDKFTVSVESSQLKYIEADFTDTQLSNDNPLTLYGSKVADDIRPYITVTAYYDDGDTTYKPVVVSGYTLSGVLEIGKTNRISVFYSGAVDYINVKVEPISLTGISVSYKQTLRIYTSTPVEELKDMFEVTALYNDNSTATVSNDSFEIYTVDANGHITETYDTTPVMAGSSLVGYTANVMISYTEGANKFSKIANIQLERFGITKLDVDFTPLEDTVFYALNRLDDLRPFITATVSIGAGDYVARTEVVTDYLLTTENGLEFTEGNNIVIANYNGVQSQPFTVYVTPKAFTGLVAEFTQVTKVFETTPLFDLKDMLAVYKQYNDGTFEEVTGYTMSVIPHTVLVPDGNDGTIETISNVLNAGTCYINVSYNDNGTLISTQFAVTVEPVELSYISVDYVQTGSLYTSDDLGDLVQWLKVWAHYDDDSTIEIITGYNLAGNLYAGTSTISVTYGGKQTTFSATVTEVKLVAMSATLNQNAKVYDSTVLDSLKGMLTVKLIYNDGNTRMLGQDEYILNGLLVADQNSRISVIYLRDRSQEAFFYVHVVATRLDRIVATLDQNAAGRIFTSTNPEDLRDYITVTAHYAVSETGSTGDVGSEIVYDYLISGELTAGTARLTINYNGYTDVITVTDVTQVVSTKIEVNFDQTGVDIYRSTPISALRALMKVTVTFNDGRVIDDFEDYVLDRVGTSRFRVSYGAATPVEKDFVLKEAQISKLEVVFEQGETKIFTSNTTDDVKHLITVNVYLTDNPNEIYKTLSDDEYTLEGTIVKGTPMLTARYNGVISRFTVNVVAPTITDIRVSEFVQGYTRIYDTTPLEYIGRLVTVTATYDDGTEAVITDFDITGTLIRGIECPVTISIGNSFAHTFTVKVESNSISGVEAVQTLPYMHVYIVDSPAAHSIRADNSQANIDYVKSLLVVHVFPQGVGIYGGLANVPADVLKACTLTTYQFEMSGDLSDPDNDGKVTLTISYTRTYTLVATITIDVTHV